MTGDRIIITHRMLKYLKVSENRATKKKISWLLEEALDYLNIKKWSRCISIDKFYDIFHPYAHESRSIARLLNHATNVWLMLVTLGHDLEKKSKEYFKNNEVFSGYILDRLGSFLIEEEVKKINAQIFQKYQKKDYTATHRYSPGYGDFSIKSQQIFFNLAKDSIPGLRISDRDILFPEKTVTAIKGVIKI
ncbi:MAG: hypothetical protein KAR45_11575 [Desulfobacteraceae bacterium]|nr:hypothetical protein [Desulfobacteraceae bacterium]